MSRREFVTYGCGWVVLLIGLGFLLVHEDVGAGVCFLLAIGLFGGSLLYARFA